MLIEQQGEQCMTREPQRPNSILRYMIIILSILVLLLVLMLGSAYLYSAGLLNRVNNTPVTAEPNPFDGRYLLSVSDGDMVGTAYADGVLMQVPGVRDTLSILPLPINYDDPTVQERFVSNSVTSWPQVMTVSPDGERAYIVETSGEVPDDVEVLPGILNSPPLGRSLTVVELASGSTTVHDVMDFPNHLAVDSKERFIAIGSGGTGEQLAILPVATLADRSTYQFFTILRADGTPAGEITSVYWHPTGRFLAVGVDRSELLFFVVDVDAAGAVTLSQHGERLTLGNSIGYGEFTADGDYYLTTEINWAAIPGSLGFIFNPPGEMISIRFDASDDAAHREVSRVAVGQSPEGFAVSPDESMIVTVDMRRTYLPNNLAFVPGTDLNSLSLLTFNHETGQLLLIDQYGFEGVLPEHAIFDADGDALGVVIYNSREKPTGPGYIEFWNVDRRGDEPVLARSHARVYVVRGPHTMAIVP